MSIESIEEIMRRKTETQSVGEFLDDVGVLLTQIPALLEVARAAREHVKKCPQAPALVAALERLENDR